MTVSFQGLNIFMRKWTFLPVKHSFSYKCNTLGTVLFDNNPFMGLFWRILVWCFMVRERARLTFQGHKAMCVCVYMWRKYMHAAAFSDSFFRHWLLRTYSVNKWVKIGRFLEWIRCILHTRTNTTFMHWNSLTETVKNWGHNSPPATEDIHLWTR